MTAARERVLSTLRERIAAYAASRIGKDFAEDLAQEALLVIESKYAALESVDDLLPVSFQILRFKLQDWRRKHARCGELALADGAASQLAVLEREELLARPRMAIAALDGRCRDLFRLKLDGRTFGEIQTAMGAATLNTVYTWDFRCRKQLLAQLGEVRP